MTVKQLINDLSKCDPNSIVILSQDEEGNGFSPLADVDNLKNYCEGEIGLRELTPKLKNMGYTKEDLLKGEKAVVLWPV